MKTIQIKNPCKIWWKGSPQIEPFMEPIISVIAKYHTPSSPEFTDIYNAVYKMAYNIIKEHDKQVTKMVDK